LGAALLGFSLLSNAGAQFSYSTDFSGTNFQANYTLPLVNNPLTQGNWYNPTADISQFTTLIVSNGVTSNYLNIGGAFLTGTNIPASYYTYAMQGINVQSNSVHFDSIFQINPGTTTQDSFGWTLFNNSGQQLISVDLNAAGTSGTNPASSSQYTLGVTSFASNSSFTSISFISATNAPATLNPLDGNTSYHLGFNVYNIGSTNGLVDVFSYNSGTNAPTYVGQAVIDGTDWSNVTGTDIAIIGATWSLTDFQNFDNYGNNFMAMNTLAVSSVPEPQTWVLFGLAGLILVVAVRRRANS